MKSFHVLLTGSADPIVLDFDLLPNPVTDKWIERVLAAQHRGYQIDDPERFYGFESVDQARFTACQQINSLIDTINSHQKIIHRRLNRVDDQDTLNYLHNIFERYHGLLDRQDHEFWNSAPGEVRQALAQLNIAVHRCESVDRGNRKRFVVTYFGLPKTVKLSMDDYKHMVRDWKFGMVHLCYVEIGKTLEDLANDNDDYVGDDAFRPFELYSADFVVRLCECDTQQRDIKEKHMWDYYDQHKEFFQSRGFKKDDARLTMGVFPVAQLVFDESNKETLLNKIAQNCYVDKVWFS